MSDTPTFGRYAEIPVDKMTPEQQKGYRFLVDGPRGRLPGPYKVWVHNPKLVHAAAPLGNHFTPGQSSLSEREREIAVVVITSTWHSAYPAAAHEKRGKEVGLPAATVEAMAAGLPASFTDARDGPNRSRRWKLASSNSVWACPLVPASRTGNAPACMPSGCPVGLKWPPALAKGLGPVGSQTPTSTTRKPSRRSGTRASPT